MKSGEFHFLMKKVDDFDRREFKKLQRFENFMQVSYINSRLEILSLKNAGTLLFLSLEDTFAEELALDIGCDPELMEYSLACLFACGYIKWHGDNEIQMPFVEASLGITTKEALRKREERAKNKSSQELGHCPEKADNVRKIRTLSEKSGQCPEKTDDVTKVRTAVQNMSDRLKPKLKPRPSSSLQEEEVKPFFQKDLKTNSLSECGQLETVVASASETHALGKKILSFDERAEMHKHENPLLQSIEGWCKMYDPQLDAKAFFDFWESSKWLDSNARPVHWQSKIKFAKKDNAFRFTAKKMSEITEQEFEIILEETRIRNAQWR